MRKLTDKQINYLGALLHDIGKFKWRAQEIKAGDNHEKLGEEFIREYLGKVECLREDIEEIIKAANRERGKIWLSDVTAAKEREDSEDKAPRRYLEAITNRVFIPELKKTKSKNFWYYNPAPLNLQKFSFPIDSDEIITNYVSDKKDYIKEHSERWESFVKETEFLKSYEDYNSFLITFYKLLEKYTSRVLSAGYLSHPDISLFDHSRITAALSLCFEEGEGTNECILVKGDIAGIQNFIYEDIQEMTDIAKRLRARSFMISMLTDVIGNFLMNRLELFPSNMIYNGGGHFIILMPNNKFIKNKLDECEKLINEKLVDKYYGKINFIQEKIDCRGEDFVNDFENIYKKLDFLLNQKKKRKSFLILDKLLSSITDAKDFRDSEKKLFDLERNIGAVLPKTKYLIYSNDITKRVNVTTVIEFDEFGQLVYLCKDKNEVENIIVNINSKGIIVSKINDTDFIGDFNLQKNLAKEFRLIGNYVPTENNIPLSFEDLAKIDSDNYPMLGIMRMDVDNLGAVFSFGLKPQNETEKKYTPSRVANLSRELNLFFTGYINILAEKYNIYIAYSGGDDVFVVGSWIKILEFARELRKYFDKFVCTNKNLSASAGIIFTKPNFPISQSSLLAEKQEKNAKDTFPVLEKDKVSIFDIQMSWEEFEEYIDWAKEVISFLEDKENKKILPRSFLHSLLSLTKRSFNDRKINLREFSRSRTKIRYQLARRKVTSEVIEKENKNDKRENMVNEILYDLALKFLKSKNEIDFYRKFEFPASIILYKTRR